MKEKEGEKRLKQPPVPPLLGCCSLWHQWRGRKKEDERSGLLAPPPPFSPFFPLQIQSSSVDPSPVLGRLVAELRKEEGRRKRGTQQQFFLSAEAEKREEGGKGGMHTLEEELEKEKKGGERGGPSL